VFGVDFSTVEYSTSREFAIDVLPAQSYRRIVMRSGKSISTGSSQGRSSRPNSTGRGRSAWRLTEQQLRELANRRARDHEGEVAWRVDAD